MKKQLLSHARLLEVVSYDAETGLFVSRIGRRRRRAGQVLGCDTGKGYLSLMIDGGVYKAHRLAWFYMFGEWPNGHIDHINGNRCDNRIGNLRDVSPAVNAQNLRGAMPRNKVGLLGVHREDGRYRACIRVGGKSKHLGWFDAPEPAHAAYVNAKRKYHEGCTL
jgi:hypothetical protein